LDDLDVRVELDEERDCMGREGEREEKDTEARGT
jgi:hypothetical protein